MSASNIPTSLSSLSSLATPPPMIYPDGLPIDNQNTVRELLASTKQIYSREQTIFKNQLVLDTIPSTPVYLDITSVPQSYGLTIGTSVARIERNYVRNNMDTDNIELLSNIVERFTLLRLVYVDGTSSYETTSTPNALTRYDSTGKPFLYNIVAPQVGVREQGYTIRVFLVPTSVNLEDISNQLISTELADIQAINTYELDNYDETYPWILDGRTGILTFLKSAPSLTTHNVFINFTRYIGTGKRNALIEQGSELPNDYTKGRFFFNTTDNNIYYANGQLWKKVNDINSTQNQILDYLTKQPPRYSEITLDDPSVYGTQSIDLSGLDIIGNQITINKGIYYEDGDDADNRKQWVFDPSLSLPYVVETVVEIRKHGTNDTYEAVFNLSSDVSSVVLQGGWVSLNKSFVINTQESYDIRVYPRNYVNSAVNTYDISNVKAISDIQESILNSWEQTYDLSLHIVTPYPDMREEATYAGFSVTSSLPKTSFRLHNTRGVAEDVSMVYVNLAQTSSISQFVDGWNQMVNDNQSFATMNKIYTNVGYLGRTAVDASNLTLVRPFASVMQDRDIATTVDIIHGRASEDICNNWLSLDESARRIQLMENGTWGGILNKTGYDTVYDEGGHWGVNVLDKLDIGINYHGFSNDSRVDGSFTLHGTPHDQQYIEFVDVSNVDTYKVLELTDPTYAQNTLIGSYQFKFGQNDDKQTIFFRDHETGEGVYTKDESGTSNMVGIYEPSTLPYYIGVIVEGYGVDGNMAGIPSTSEFIYAQRVMVDYLKGLPSLNTFIAEYNFVKPLEYDAPMIAWCCGVPSLVALTLSIYSEVGNVCGTVLPSGGVVANYQLLSSVSIDCNPMELVKNGSTWNRDVSSTVVNDTFDIVEETMGDAFTDDVSGIATQHVLSYFGDTVIQDDQVPISKVTMYSVNKPDGEVDYGVVQLIQDIPQGGIGFVHSDARSFVGRQSKKIGELLYDAVNDSSPSRYERVGYGGIAWQDSITASNQSINQYNVVSLARDQWMIDSNTWELSASDFEHSGVYSHETPIDDDQLLFYGGAFVNQHATIHHEPIVKADGSTYYMIDPSYSNPYDIASQVWTKYEALLPQVNDSQALSAIFTATANVADYSTYKGTGSTDKVIPIPESFCHPLIINDALFFWNWNDFIR